MQLTKAFIVCALVVCTVLSQAQEAKQEQPQKGCSCSFKFHSINQAGIVSGSRGLATQLQTINGLQYGAWFAGIGFGLDRYYRDGYPLFLDIRRYLLKRPSSPYLYIDGGINIIKQRKQAENQWYENTFKNGWYTDAGVGQKFALGKKSMWLVSAGYTFKTMQRRYEYIGGCTWARCTESYSLYKSYMHRFTIKLGVQL